MKSIQYYLLAVGVLIPIALWFAGHEGAAGFVLLFTSVIEIVYSVITGKKGNETER